jgi:hypothetical protein
MISSPRVLIADALRVIPVSFLTALLVLHAPKFLVPAAAQSATQVTLQPSPVPSSAEPGVTYVNLTGTNFPSGATLDLNGAPGPSLGDLAPGISQFAVLDSDVYSMAAFQAVLSTTLFTLFDGTHFQADSNYGENYNFAVFRGLSHSRRRLFAHRDFRFFCDRLSARTAQLVVVPGGGTC